MASTSRDVPAPTATEFRIEHIWAFLSVDENGEEGVIAFRDGDTQMPMIAANEARLDDLLPIAQLVRFDQRTDLGVISS